MNRLFILYDPHCGLCREARDWISSQPAYLQIELLASDSEEARRRFPNLPPGELTVISDRGDVWLGDHAFIMCLWALWEFRHWALRLTSPLLRPMTRQAYEAVSHNRKNVSALLRLKSEAELRKKLSEVAIPSCPIS